MHAAGNFTVDLTPQAEQEGVDPAIGRLVLRKTFEGDLLGDSTGQMLAMHTKVDGSAGYVAMEVFRGALQGRRGSFALQHSGTMDNGKQALGISVVPDSATGELAGLRGTLQITIAAGVHSYDFDYVLPPARSPLDSD